MQVLHYTELDPKERADPMAVVFPKVRRRGKNMMVVKSAQKNMILDVDMSRLTVVAEIYFAVFEEIFVQLRELSVFKFCSFVKYLFPGVQVHFPQVRCLWHN